MNTTQSTNGYALKVYPPEQQGSGAFDGGKITEIKPIPFPQESGGAKRTGPLLYWAWASAKGDGVIGMHPHQGFEIISYVMEGAVGHTDTAGNNRRVSAGGIQVMQTGSGISHQEEMYGERTEFFQIWFEPNMKNALRRSPLYFDHEDAEFPRETLESKATIKRIVGPKGLAKIDAPIVWDDITLEKGGSYRITLEPHSLAAMVLTRGEAEIQIGEENQGLNRRDFAMILTESTQPLTLTTQSEGSRFTLITSPIDPGYPLIQL